MITESDRNLKPKATGGVQSCVGLSFCQLWRLRLEPKKVHLCGINGDMDEFPYPANIPSAGMAGRPSRNTPSPPFMAPRMAHVFAIQKLPQRTLQQGRMWMLWARMHLSNMADSQSSDDTQFTAHEHSGFEADMNTGPPDAGQTETAFAQAEFNTRMPRSVERGVMGHCTTTFDHICSCLTSHNHNFLQSANSMLQEIMVEGLPTYLDLGDK